MINSLTTLRGVFIIFIFFHHCLNIYPGGGTMAVAFFFVLSGFSMTLGYKDKVMSPDFKFKQYFIRRCIKFYPLHWLCLLSALVLSMSFEFLRNSSFYLNAALIQSWVPNQSVYFSYNAVSWYLSDTIFFALVFPFLYRLIVKATAYGRVLIAVIFASLYIIIVYLLPTVSYHDILYISPYVRLIDFVFGIYLAILYCHIRKKYRSFTLGNSTIITLSVFIVISLLIYESLILDDNLLFIAPVYWPFIAILLLFVSLPQNTYNRKGHLLENKHLVYLGECSFTIYLIHYQVLAYSSTFFTIFQIKMGFSYVVFTFVLTILVSILVKEYITNNITQWLTKKIQPYMTVRS